MRSPIPPRRVLVLTVCAGAVAVLTGCASSSGEYTLAKYAAPSADSPAAQIHSTGGIWKGASRGITGGVATIDEAETPASADILRVAPGNHHLGINCLFMGQSWGGSVNQSLLQHIVVTGDILADRNYYVRCENVGGRPRAWLSEAPDSASLPPGFTSMCAQSCEGFP